MGLGHSPLAAAMLSSTAQQDVTKCLPKRRSNACSRIRKPRDAAVKERIPLSELVHEEIMDYGSSSCAGSRNASHTMILSMLEVPNGKSCLELLDNPL